MKRSRSQRGNVFTALLGGIVLSGTLSVALYQLMGGPVLSTVRLAKQTAGGAEVHIVSRMAIADAARQADSDCDGDGYIEPRQWRAAGAGVPKPDGGGLVPLTVGAAVTDPWGTDYGYCVWDMGPYNDPAIDRGTALGNTACPASANRLKGSPLPSSGSAVSQTVMAVISAGPDKTFQTSCASYDITNPDADLIATSGDDIVARYTYSEASQATSALWTIKPGDPDTARTDKDIKVGNDDDKGAIAAASLVTRGKVMPGGAALLGDQNTISVCDPGHAGLLRYNDGTGTVPSVRQSAVSAVSALGNGASTTLSLPQPPRIGNTIVVVVSGYAAGGAFALPASGVTDNMGGADNTYIEAVSQAADGGCNGVLKMFHRIVENVAPGPFTVTVTPTTSNKASIALLEVQGVLAASPVDVAHGTTGTATETEHTTGATAQAPEIAISAIGARCSSEADAGYAPDTGADWTLIPVTASTNSHAGLAVAHKALTASGPVTNTWQHTNQPAGADALAIATFKARPAAASIGLEYCDGSAWSTISGAGGGSGGWSNGGGADCLGNTATPCNNKLDDARTEYESSFAVGLGKDALATIDTSLTGNPIRIVQQKQANSVSNNTAISATLDDLPAAGNSIIVLLSVKNATPDEDVDISSVTDNQAGNGNYSSSATSALSCTGDPARKRRRTAIYHKHGIGVNAGTFTVTATASANSQMEMRVMEVEGLSDNAPERTGSGTSGPGSGTTTATISSGMTQAYQLAIAGMTHCNAVSPITWGHGTATPANTNNPIGMDPTQDWLTAFSIQNGDVQAGANFVYRILSSAVTASYTWSHTATTNSTSPWAIATFRGGDATAPVYTSHRATAAGYKALEALTTGTDTTALGHNAGFSVTTAPDNTAAGDKALDAATTGSGGNTAIGASALTAVTTGVYNTAVGASAAPAQTTGGYLTAIGANALNAHAAVSTTTDAPTAVGYQALNALNALSATTAIGYQALLVQNAASDAVAIGYQAGKADTSGQSSAYFGYKAGENVNSMDESAAFGANAGSGLTSRIGVAFGHNSGRGIGATGGGVTAFGSNTLRDNDDEGNTAFGANVLSANTSGGAADPSGNTGFGANALAANTSGRHNTAFGSSALAANTTGHYNTAMGYMANGQGATPEGATALGAFALMKNTGAGNTAIGYQALMNNTTGEKNTAAGYQALMNNTTGSYNTASGAWSMHENTTGSDNTAFGAYSLYSNTGGSYNTAMGYQALYSNSEVAGDYGMGNTAIGYQALYSNTSGDYNTAMGDSALYGNTTGSENTALGYRAMYGNVTGSQNTCSGAFCLHGNAASGNGNTGVGFRTMYSFTTGSYNTAMGAYSMESLTTGSYNTAFGAFALRSNTTDSYNTAMGYQSLALSNKGDTITANTAFGHNALYSNVTGVGNTAVGANALVSNNAGGSASGITVVQTTPLTAQTTAAASASVTFDSTPSAGSTIIVMLAARNTADDGYQVQKFASDPSIISDNQGGAGQYKIAKQTTQHDGHAVVIYYRSNISAPGGAFTVTATPPVNLKITMAAIEVTGLDNANPIDQVSAYSPARDENATSATVRVGPGTQDNELAVVAIADTDSTLANKNFAIEGGWTDVGAHQNNSTGVAASFAYKVLSSARAPTEHTWTFTDNNTAGDDWDRSEQSAMATFRAAAAAPVTGGEYNTAMGAFAMHNNTTGSYNSAFGNYALASNVTGSYNTAFGDLADIGGLAVTGAANSGGLIQLTVASTAAFTTGDVVRVSGVGGVPNATGSWTITVDDGTHITLQGSTFAGSYTSGGIIEADNSTAIGYNAKVYKSNTIRIGNTSIGRIQGQVAFSNLSDRRLKKDIQDSDLALDFVMKLRPVSYRRIGGNGRLDYGFIAQEVEEALEGRLTNMISRDGDAMHTYSLRHADLLAPAIRAIQQQRETEEAQDAEIAQLKARLAKLKAKLGKMTREAAQ